MAKINQKTFKEALKNSGGNQARIAEKLEVTRQAIGLYLKKNPKMRTLLEQEAEFVIDVAEDNIDIDIVTHKDLDSSKWKLLHSKRGKKRGYGTKQEIEHVGTGEIIFKEVTKSYKDIKDGRKRDHNKSKTKRNS